MFDAVTYHLPKSTSFAQATKGKPRLAWPAIQNMLATLATEVQLAPQLQLCVDGPGQWLDAAIAQTCLEEARSLFGPEQHPEEQSKCWTLGPEYLDRAVAFALSDDRWPRQQGGPVGLLVAYRFAWQAFDPALSAAWPSQQDAVNLMLLHFHHGTLTVMPRLVFPVPYDSDAFKAFMPRLQAAAPFTIKPAYLRRMVVNPKNGAIRLLRLADG